MRVLKPFMPCGGANLAFKNRLYSKHNGCCQYCGEHIESAKQANLDHIKPKFNGGSDAESNLRLACRYCNSAKAHHDVEHLRWCLTVKFSALEGVISPKQAKQLMEMGYFLDLTEDFVFAYEKEQAEAT